MEKEQKKVDLIKFNYNELDRHSTPEQLLAEAKNRGFYLGRTPYNKLFSKLFFNGGEVTFKSGLNESFRSPAWEYCRHFMSSFFPKHEEKEAICAMLMSELLQHE